VRFSFSVSGHVGVVRVVYPFDMVLSLAPAGGQPASSVHVVLELNWASSLNLLGGRASGRPYSPLNETSKQKKRDNGVSLSSLSIHTAFWLVIDLVSGGR